MGGWMISLVADACRSCQALGNLGMKTKDFSVSSDLLLEAGFARPVTTLDDDTTIPLHVFLKVRTNRPMRGSWQS